MFATSAPFCAVAASSSDFVDSTLYASNGTTVLLPSRLYVPSVDAGQDPDRPLIVFLHGLGEGGRDNLQQINGNINRLLAEAKQRNAFLLAPQSYNGYWHNPSHTANIMSTIDLIAEQYNVDRSRLYITGLSAGGAGVWNVLARQPNDFAAGVAMAAAPPAREVEVAWFKDVPIRAYHNRNDTTVTPGNARTVINKYLEANGVTPLNFNQILVADQTFTYENEELGVFYTEWPTGGHNAWTRGYDQEDMYDWLFSQQIPEPSAALLVAGGVLVVMTRRSRLASLNPVERIV